MSARKSHALWLVRYRFSKNASWQYSNRVFQSENCARMDMETKPVPPFVQLVRVESLIIVDKRPALAVEGT